MIDCSIKYSLSDRGNTWEKMSSLLFQFYVFQKQGQYVLYSEILNIFWLYACPLGTFRYTNASKVVLVLVLGLELFSHLKMEVVIFDFLY